MMTTRNGSRAIWMGMAASLGLVLGTIACEGSETGDATETTEVVEPVTAAASTQVRIERALRDIETGHDLKEAAATLEQMLKDPATTSDQRDDARLALSRAHELSGDGEAAVRVVEELLASHRVDTRFPARELAHKRLRLLLTGSEEDTPRLPEESDVAPIAKALSEHFVAGADGTTNVQLLLFGRSSEGDTMGTFNIAGALQAKKREACPLCSDSVSVNTSRSQTSSWVTIPAAAAADPAKEPTLAKALTVFYYDLATNRIPSRYDTYLPMPSDEIASHLEKGEGLIVVKSRAGVPPVIVLAAPRWAMLADVEAAFAKMTSLPTEPTPVSLSINLRSKEIQSVVRGTYSELRRCYETHLASVPDAQGKMVMSFAISGDGTVTDLDSTGSTLTDAALRGCFEATFSRMKFPAIGGKTTVKYPIVLSPSQDG